MGYEISPARAKRHAKARAAEGKKWKRKNGPVTSRIATPEELAELKSGRVKPRG